MIKFATKKELADFLIGTATGRRLVSWVMAKHWSRIAGTELEFELAERLRGSGRVPEEPKKEAKAENETKQANKAKIVIELFPDGYVRVFASEPVMLAWIKRIRVSPTPEAELVEEQIAEARCPMWARDTYGDGRKVVGTEFIDGRSAKDVFIWGEFAKHVKMVGNRKSPAGS